MNRNPIKKGSAVALAIVLAASLAVIPLSLAGAAGSSSTNILQELQQSQAQQEEQAVTSNAAGTQDAAGDCTVTLEYWENVNYDDPEYPPNSEGRRLLGTRVLTGLHEGDVLDTWDYVVDIPGHFFWDAWPAKLTVSTDPSQNVIKLFYFKFWNSEYTVNYYVMTGADLTADNWLDALKPEDVEFTKIASDTFTNQRFDELVVGDAYEYKVDGLYVIDTYPAEIRLGTDPDNNVLNVLYTPTSANLPDDVEVPDFDDSGNGDASGPLPDDTVMDKDDLITVLPDDVVIPDGVVDDFIGSDGDGTVDITDDMLANPVSPEQAAAVKSAYLASLSMPQTGDNATLFTAAAIIAVLALAVAVMAIIFGRRHDH